MDRLRTLMQAKQLLLEADEAWANYSEKETSAALAKIEKLDGDLLNAGFEDSEAKLIGLEILLVGDDTPNFADDFKNQLFERLRASAHKR